MALQINVYDELKNGCYICSPRLPLCTWGEMEQMFSETDVSLDELNELYGLYNDMAARRLSEFLSRDEFLDIESEKLEFDSEVREVPAILKAFLHYAI